MTLTLRVFFCTVRVEGDTIFVNSGIILEIIVGSFSEKVGGYIND